MDIPPSFCWWFCLLYLYLIIMNDHISIDSLWLVLYKLREMFMSHGIESNLVALSMDLTISCTNQHWICRLDYISIEIWSIAFHRTLQVKRSLVKGKLVAKNLKPLGAKSLRENINNLILGEINQTS